MREVDIKEYGTLDANTLVVVSRRLTRYNTNTVKPVHKTKIIQAISGSIKKT